MARFAGNAPSFFAPPEWGAAGGGSNYAAAAGIVDVNNALDAQKSKSPRFDELASAAMQTNSMEKQAAMMAESGLLGSGMQALGNAKYGQLMGEASLKAAEKAAEGQKKSSLFGSLGNIAAAAIPLIPGIGPAATVATAVGGGVGGSIG